MFIPTNGLLSQQAVDQATKLKQHLAFLGFHAVDLSVCTWDSLSGNDPVCSAPKVAARTAIMHRSHKPIQTMTNRASSSLGTLQARIPFYWKLACSFHFASSACFGRSFRLRTRVASFQTQLSTETIQRRLQNSCEVWKCEKTIVIIFA